MRPLRLSARNLRTWAELELELPDGIAAVVGPNGAGKSSLVQAIELALFGKGRELKRLATRGADAVELALEFEHGGDRYRVQRSYKLAGRGKPSLELARWEEHDAYDPGNGDREPDTYPAVAWASLTRETIDETEAELERILGLSRRTFRASSYLAQDDGAAFTKAEPRERKAIILDALGVHVWDRLKEEAAARRLEEERDLAGLDGRCGALDRELAQRDTVEAQVRLAEDTRAPLAADVAEVEGELEELRAELEEALEAGSAKTALQARVVTALQALTDKRGAARHELNQRDAAIEAKSQAAERLEALERQAEGDEERAKVELDRLVEARSAHEADKAKMDAGEARCPTCRQELHGDALESALAAVRGFLSELDDRQGETLGRAQEAARRREAAGEELSRMNAEVKSLMAERLERKSELVAAVTELEEAAARAQEELAEHDGPDVDLIRRRLADTEAMLAAKRRALEAATLAVGKAREQAQRLLKVADERNELERQRISAGRRIEILRLGERAFGRDGVPALILEAAAIPQLESHANAVVSELGRDYLFELRTLRETQTGAAKEALDVVVHTATGEALYEDFSGGERTRLDLALRIALARLLASRRGADVRLLAIDEPAYLDEDGFLALAGVLRSLAGEFDTILVVSHDDALRDAFDSAIIVGGGADTGEPSRLEEVS